MNEKELRELAYQHRGEVEEGSAVAVEARRLSQMISLRLDADLIADLRDVANQRGQTMSDLLRDAAARMVAAARTSRTGAALSALKVAVTPPTFGSTNYQTGNPAFIIEAVQPAVTGN